MEPEASRLEDLDAATVAAARCAASIAADVVPGSESNMRRVTMGDSI